MRANLIGPFQELPDHCLLPEHYKLDLMIPDGISDCCHSKLRIQRTSKRYPVSILLGMPVLHHHIKQCLNCGKYYPCDKINELMPPHSNYGYDIIIEVGLGRFQYHRQDQEIQKTIQKRYSLSLSESSVNELADSFLDYFAAVHYAKANAIHQRIRKQGGYVAHLDGTCEADTDTLFTIIDEISGIVLITGRMSAENVKDIECLLTKCKELFGVPLATMRDLSNTIATARDQLFSEVPDLICQYHFLENVGKALFKDTHQQVTNLLRKLKIKPGLKSLRHSLIKWSKKQSSTVEQEVNEFITNPNGKWPSDTAYLRKYFTYFILRWLDDYTSELKGEYFPFDQPSLIFYRRCVKLYDLLNDLLVAVDHVKTREKQTLISILGVLQPIKNDKTLVTTVQRLEKQVELFEKLRDILRFKRSDNKPILRQRPPRSTIEDARKIQKRLSHFHRQLGLKATADNPDIVVSSKIILDYLDKYSTKLVGHILTLPDRDLLLDRTNNICEQRFGNKKSKWRRKLGTKNLRRHLQAARHEEFLVANLDKQDYIDSIYDGTVDNMAYNFAKYCHSALELRNLRKNQQERKAMPCSKKSLRKPEKLLNAILMIKAILLNGSIPALN